MALVASDEALAEAGWDGEMPYDARRVGSIIGTGIGGIGTLTQNHQVLLEQGAGKVSPLAIPLMMGNAGSGAVAMRHKLKGPSFAPLSACAAGAHAIGEAVELIESGRADAVVAGGSEAGLVPLARAAFSALDALSPTGVSRPFDVRRDGFVMGEGAAVLILEDAEKARERGANVLAYVRGYGATTDAYHLTAPDKEGLGAAEAMRIALADAGLTPEDVVYVNAHGTSTPLNDRSETKALKLALGDAAKAIPVSSTKSAIGHLLGAAGAVEAVATILALRDRIAPPTLGHEEPEEGLDLDYVPGKARPLDIDGKPAVGLSNAFGFGGHNAVLCLEAA
jgi:3-oxoacyl-[acyl-carrier-protein] synthase II